MLFWTTYYSFIASGLQFQAVFSEVLFETNKQTNETKQNKRKSRYNPLSIKYIWLGQ